MQEQPPKIKPKVLYRWRRYEVEKAKLEDLGLSPDDYERAIAKLLKKLKV